MEPVLTKGPVTKNILLFAFPMICGNMLQQFYNVADTLIVGRYIGEKALAAVGSSYALMTFLTSVFLGMCMGSGAIFSIRFGEKNMVRLQENVFTSFIMIGLFSLVLNLAVFFLIQPVMVLLHVPLDVSFTMHNYLRIIFFGIFAIFLYNFFSSFLRSAGNSAVPLLFLGISAMANIILDCIFVICFHLGVEGTAIATVISQWLSGIGVMIYTLIKYPSLFPSPSRMRVHMDAIREITEASALTCLQQSVMNLGILTVQGLINRFGSVVMAGFAVASKIDSFAYMPLQDFGNAVSTFIAQNYGARKKARIQKGIRASFITMFIFSTIISVIILLFAKPLLLLFIRPQDTEILATGISYLHVVGLFYFGIGALFLLYGLYRAFNRPGISLILTVFSLGTRVLLAYYLSSFPWPGIAGIWWAVPIGWLLADSIGIGYYFRAKKTLYAFSPKIPDPGPEDS